MTTVPDHRSLELAHRRSAPQTVQEHLNGAQHSVLGVGRSGAASTGQDGGMGIGHSEGQLGVVVEFGVVEVITKDGGLRRADPESLLDGLQGSPLGSGPRHHVDPVRARNYGLHTGNGGRQRPVALELGIAESVDGDLEDVVQGELEHVIDRLELLVFSDDASVRQEVIEGVGRRPARGLPLVSWTRAATAEGVRLAIRDRAKEGKAPFDVLVLDAETKKFGGMGLAHELFTELDSRPPVVLLTARPQDDWLAAWSKAEAVVPRPLDPMALQEGVTKAFRARRGAVVPAG